MKIALLNAHTDYAPGANAFQSGELFTEYRWSVDVNKKLQIILQNKGFETHIIDASFIKPYSRSLDYKVSFVNDEKADIAIETHMNAAALFTNYSSGMEILYSKGRKDSEQLAIQIIQDLKTYIPVKVRRGNGLYPKKNIYVLNRTDCPSVLIESLFLTNPIDRLFLLHPRAAEVIANGISVGVLKYIKGLK